MDRLPPLTALRAFEAAARHLSFAKAASELSVTPAALSFQIKSLEEHLGAPVFRRLNRAVELTEVGRTLSPGCSEGFRTLGTAWAQAKRLLDTQHLTVTAGPAFTAKWLAPRLYEFAQAHPEVELRFSASLRLVDIDRDDVDVAIRFGYGPDDGLYSLPLAEEWVSPAMTPELAACYPTPETLTKAPLIFDTSIDFLKPRADWAAWFRAVGIDHTPRHGPAFTQADHAVDAALSGVGVVLGRRALVVKEIQDGRLVAPYKVALNTGATFRFLCPLGTEERPQVAAFRSWVVSEVEKTRAVTEAMDIRPIPAMSA
ncbi:MAG: transcriptional regulator GcvA [Pseudomonadota bacterium]